MLKTYMQDWPWSRAQAIEEKKKFYFDWLPCEKGHTSLRQTKDTKCLSCRKTKPKKIR